MLALIPLLVVSSSAHAQAPLVPRWDQPVRYHAEAAVSTPNGMLVLGVANLEAAARTHEMMAELSCTGAPDGAGWEVICTLDQIRFSGQAFHGDQADLDAILAEYEAMLKGKHLQLSVAKDGRITTVDLEGVERVDERTGRILEHQRQLMRRLVAPLDLGLPKKGELADSWKQKGTPLLYELMTAYGTSGGRVMKHKLEGTDGDVVTISTFGRANVATGIDREVAVSEIVNLVGGGMGRFDTASGQLLWREVSVTGELTAESVQLGDVNVYALAAWMGRVEADGRVQGASGPESLGGG